MAKVGKWITLIAGGLLVLCIAPIFLYVFLGPADGNPVGLGLLFVIGGPICGVATAVGAVIWLIGWARDRGPA